MKTKDELREAAEIAGTRAFPAHPHFRGTGAALYIEGYEAGKPKWIPVSERLPDTARFVWVTITDLGSFPLVFEAHRDFEGLTLTGWCVKFYDAKYRPLTDGQKVIAWQEIARTPEPYTEGE